MAQHRVLVYSLIGIIVLNIEASLYKDIACHRSQDDKPDNRDSRRDSKYIDQHVHMHMLIKVFTFRRCIIANACSL